MRKPESLAEALWRRVDRSGDGCWPFLGAVSDTGYGAVCFRGRNISAHRAAWEITSGPIPAGLVVCHHCDNPRCVRADPDPTKSHLFLGTKGDNSRDAVRKGRLVKGARTGNARLTDAKVAEIRRRIQAGEFPSVLAAEFGVSRGAVDNLWLRRSWAHVPGGKVPGAQPVRRAGRPSKARSAAPVLQPSREKETRGRF